MHIVARPSVCMYMCTHVCVFRVLLRGRWCRGPKGWRCFCVLLGFVFLVVDGVIAPRICSMLLIAMAKLVCVSVRTAVQIHVYLMCVCVCVCGTLCVHCCVLTVIEAGVQ